MIQHIDDRRILIEWASGEFKTVKTLYIKQEMYIGDHYHLKKDEVFFLALGEFLELTLGDSTAYNVKAPYTFTVPRGMYHKFKCSIDSILLCACTEQFDSTDEIYLASN
jgi:mannose-6-phosphate isomerase-like protein (cupin superfamily)